MKVHKILASKLFWFGVVGLAGLLLGGATSCRAQEVNPAQFTDTGVEDAFPPKKPVKKSSLKTSTAAHANAKQTASNRTMVRRRKTHHPAHKQNVVLKPKV